MIHEIEQPDWAAAERAPRRIVWDDETGEVSGDHTDAPVLARVLGDGEIGGVGAWLPDIDARAPGDFLAALRWVLKRDYAPAALPPSLRGVAPREMHHPPPGVLA